MWLYNYVGLAAASVTAASVEPVVHLLSSATAKHPEIEVKYEASAALSSDHLHTRF